MLNQLKQLRDAGVPDSEILQLCEKFGLIKPRKKGSRKPSPPKPRFQMARINQTDHIPIRNPQEIMKHYCEELVPEILTLPTESLKSKIVEMYELLANLEEKESDRIRLRQKACKIVLIDDYLQLIYAVLNLAIPMRRR